MPNIKKILASHDESATQLALRSDGMYVVGLMLTEGSAHEEQEHVDYYVGPDERAARDVFEHLTRGRKNDTIDDSNGGTE